MLRLLLAIVLGLWASLVFIHTENLFLFQLTIGATEYGHWFALLTFVLALFGYWKPGQSVVASVILVVAGLTFLWPMTQAWLLAGDVSNRVNTAFPNTVSAEKAFSFSKLWFGTKVPQIAPQKLAYTTHANKEGEPLCLYFYPAKSARPAPCILVLHTGGWFSGTPLEFEKMNCWLAEQGYAVAALEYRFAPRWPWPAQRDDVADAMQFLTTNAARLQIDPTRFILFGRSAGGQIAEATAYEKPHPNIRGCIAFYAPADLNFAYRYARPDDILDSYKLVRDYMGGTPQTVGANYDSASAILHVTAQSPPTLLMHGTPDKLVWVKQSRRFAAVLAQNKTNSLFIELPWATHAFDYNFDGPGGQISRYAVEHFLANITR